MGSSLDVAPRPAAERAAALPDQPLALICDRLADVSIVGLWRDHGDGGRRVAGGGVSLRPAGLPGVRGAGPLSALPARLVKGPGTMAE